MALWEGINGKLLAELAEYTGMDPWLVEERCKYAGVELAWRWREYAGGGTVMTPFVRDSFYHDMDLYLFDLTGYHSQLHSSGAHAWLQAAMKELHLKKVLDFGGGTGEWTITAANQAKVYYLDIKGSEVERYAMWRFEKHGVRAEVIHGDEWKKHAPYDLIIAMDVFEHLPHPEGLIDEFAKSAKYLLANPTEIRYNVQYPMHISHYELEPHWKHISAYLWASCERGKK